MRIYLFAIILFTLAGCGSSDSTSEPAAYIVAGQSNADLCDWSYYENTTGNRVQKIARGGLGIDQLIDYLYVDTQGLDPDTKGIFFIHGESDAGPLETDPQYYIERVEYYRLMLSEAVGHNLPLYISQVGYYWAQPKERYDAFRDAIAEYAENSSMWIVQYDGAKTYRERGMIYDHVHFTDEGCRLLMDAFSPSAF